MELAELECGLGFGWLEEKGFVIVGLGGWELELEAE